MTFHENEEILTLELASVTAWEKKQKDLWFWEKIGRLPFALLDKWTPRFIQNKLGQLMDELGQYMQTGGKYLINPQDICRRLEAEVGASAHSPLSLEQVGGLPLAVMDATAQKLRQSRSTIAGIQGAATGVGGIFTLAIDIPLLLGLSLKTLQEMAICYGYDPRDRAERLFIIKCLQFTSSDIVGKQAILEELAAFGQAETRRQVMSQLQGWREVVATYTENFGWKKLLQLIPIAGILFGAYLNRATIDEVAETGMMLYRKRRILEKLAQRTDPVPGA